LSGFHYFEPALNRFFDISNSFFIGLPLRETTRRSRNFSYKITCFILFNYYMQLYFSSLRQK
jgi:hypothetical protein